MPVLPPQDGREYQPAAIKRISWAAIFAGIIIVLVVQLTLSLFGLGIGASTIDPVEGETPAASTISIGAAIWWIVVSIIALFTGGWVAGRLAGMPTQTDGLLHGFITWGAATLIAVYFLTSTAGSILGGTFGVMGDVLAATGYGVAAIAPNITEFASQQLKQSDLTWKDIKQEARLLLQQTGKEKLQPGTLEDKAVNTSETMKESLQESATTPRQTDEEIMTVLDLIIRKGKNVVSEVDKEALTNILVARTDMSRSEAEQTVQRWMDTYQAASTKFAELQGQAQQQGLQAAAATAEAVSQASIWAFISLIVGASAAAIGGALGAPRDIVQPTTTRL